MSDRIETVSSGSSLLAWVTTVAQFISRSYRTSRLHAILDRIAQVTRESWLFRWLTAEPDPDVIVIDLTETRTIGPFIALFDRCIPLIERAWNGSALQTTCVRTTNVLRTAPVQLASVVVLAIVVVLFAQHWSSAGTTAIVVYCLVTILSLLGLRVTKTWEELEESRAGRLVAAVLTPPDPPTESPPADAPDDHDDE